MGDEGQKDIHRRGSDGGVSGPDKTFLTNKSNAGGLLVDLFSEDNKIGSEKWKDRGTAVAPERKRRDARQPAQKER